MSRNVVAVVSSALFVILAALLIFVPVPYVTWKPGQTVDVMMSSDEGPLIEVVGYPGSETSGKLIMTTVSTTRVDSSVSLPEAMLAYLGESSDVMPRDVVYAPGKSDDQVREEAVQMMDQSREYSTVAALRAAGEVVTEVPMVTAVSVSGPAYEYLQPGDFIESVDDKPVSDIEGVVNAIQSREVGDTVVFRVRRDGKEETVSIVTGAGQDAKPVVGINVGIGYTYTQQVVFRVDPDIVGSSAGLVFALAVYQKISEADLLGERAVAGTGTIDASGSVGAIGGIREKVKGAEDAGAEIFLLPEANCESLGDLKTDLRLVPVGTLGDAIFALQLLRPNLEAEGVPSCE